MYYVFIFDISNCGWVESGRFKSESEAMNFASKTDQVEFRNGSTSIVLQKGSELTLEN